MKTRVMLWFVCCALCSEAWAQQLEHARVSAREVVQSFYDWYLPRIKGGELEPVRAVLRDRQADFTASVVRGLRRSVKRQSEGKDGYVDVDVFLGAQDVAREYKITGVECTKGDCLVSMAADWGNGQGYVPGVVVVVSREQGRWKIADIRYAGTSGSLLGELGLASAHMK